MKTNQVLLLSGSACLLLATLAALDDKLSEAAPILLILGMGCFAARFFRTWRSKASIQQSGNVPGQMLSRISLALALGGLSCLLLCGLSFCLSALEEFAPAGLLGLLLLVVSVVARIARGMLVQRVDASSGGISIAVIMGLTAIVLVLLGFIFIVFQILSGLGFL